MVFMQGSDKRKIIDDILDDCSLTLHEYCRFDALSDSLLPCRAASSLDSGFSPSSPPKTVIAVLFPYRFNDRPGNLSHYARVPDYHTAAGNALKRAAQALTCALPEHGFVSFIDNSPIPEVLAAALAGLGCVGDHGLLINPIYGSWVFIGTIVTDLDLAPHRQTVKSCSHCGVCTSSCPGSCIGDSRETCVSKISQTKGVLSLEQQAILKKSKMAWGCDRCQEVCPMNVDALIDPHPCFEGVLFEPSLQSKHLTDLRGKAYGWRGAEVLKRNLKLIDEL